MRTSGKLAAIVGFGSVLGSAHASAADPGFVVTYPAPLPSSAIEASARYSVKVDGQPVFVRNLSRSSDAWFAFAGEVEVEVTLSEPIEQFTLSPKSLGIVPEVAGNVLRFRLREPRKLILHGVNALDEVLAIWADPIEDDAPQLGAPGVVDAVAEGVDATGESDTTDTLQALIDGLGTGDTLYLREGVYRVTYLTLKSDMTLYFAPGAILEADAGDHDDIIAIPDRANVAIRGRGTINANGQIFSGGNDADNKRAVTIRSSGANHVFRDFCLRESQLWTWLMYKTDGATIDNVKLLISEDGENRDGIDPNNVVGLHIDDVFIRSGDDSIVMKSGDTLTPPIDLGAVIRNSVLWNWGNGANLKFGPYWIDVTRGIRVENIDMISGPRNVSFLFEQDQVPEDLLFQNLRVEGALEYLMDIGRNAYNGGLKNVRFDGLYVDHDLPALLEPTETFELTLANFYRGDAPVQDAAAGLVEGSGADKVVFAHSEPTVVGVRATRLVVGEEDAQPGEFTLTRTGPTDAPLTVEYAIRGTASPGDDYTPLSGEATILAGESAVVIPVAPVADADTEEYETVFVRLELGDTYMLGTDFHAVVTIVDGALGGDTTGGDTTGDATTGDATGGDTTTAAPTTGEPPPTGGELTGGDMTAGTSSAGTTAATTDAATGGDASGGGCACAADGHGPKGMSLAAALAILGLRRRRSPR